MAPTLVQGPIHSSRRIVRPAAQSAPSLKLVNGSFRSQDRADVRRPDVESEVIQLLRKHGVEFDERYIWR
jgi:hypothetical protein